MVLVLSKINPVAHRDTLFLLRSVLILPYHLHLAPTSGLFLSGFPIKMVHAFIVSPGRSTCLTLLVLPPRLVAVVIFGADLKKRVKASL